MAKGDKFYFENFAESTALSRKAALYLVECLENYDTEKLEDMLVTMHEIEHAADKKKHEMEAALAKAFVTPVDREDLDLLSRNLDDVTDKIEAILQKLYIYDIQKINPTVIEFAKKIVSCCETLCAIMGEFENFKRSKKMRELIIKLNDIEEECDGLYIKSMRELTKNSTDVLETVSMRKIYDYLESCSDACEHAGECVRMVIMKNT